MMTRFLQNHLEIRCWWVLFQFYLHSLVINRWNLVSSSSSNCRLDIIYGAGWLRSVSVMIILSNQGDNWNLKHFSRLHQTRSLHPPLRHGIMNVNEFEAKFAVSSILIRFSRTQLVKVARSDKIQSYCPTLENWGSNSSVCNLANYQTKICKF